MNNIKLVIGAGHYNNNPGWTHTQENEIDLVNRRTWERTYKKNTIAAILAEHVWEHLSWEEGIQAAKICYDFLRPGGHFRCAVPDGFFKDTDYQHMVQVGGPGPKDHPCASHKMVYNYKTLTACLQTAGFEIMLLEYCDEKGDFYFTEWKKEDGVIFRSKKIDPRNQGDTLQFASLIVDAVKPNNTNNR
ncbi:class I SAM-dependent methyltransferase [Radiobacillus sp. PE A8.2]|uniref:class I SAM-dependent methyltransferase n=1 Tax=Radiobacillus sp. PE A8.2 TaxID=3380349 RepID=UPI003890C1B5